METRNAAMLITLHSGHSNLTLRGSKLENLMFHVTITQKP